MLRRRLERRGFVVIAARDGRSGVIAAEQEQPDLVLMDLSLPELDGWQATRLLKGVDAEGRALATEELIRRALQGALPT